MNPLDNGLERFSSAMRRQNFLIPPRRHRAFPLLELTQTVHPRDPVAHLNLTHRPPVRENGVLFKED